MGLSDKYYITTGKYPENSPVPGYYPDIKARNVENSKYAPRSNHAHDTLPQHTHFTVVKLLKTTMI
jgi:hypothetical protein